MEIWDSLKESLQRNSERKEREKQIINDARLEVEIEKQKIFQEAFKKNALEVAKGQAYKEAAEKSGLQKLRAVNRSRRLNENNITPGSIFERLSEYTKKNLANRQENLDRTKAMRNTALEMKETRDTQRLKERQDRVSLGASGFKKPIWRM